MSFKTNECQQLSLEDSFMNLTDREIERSYTPDGFHDDRIKYPVFKLYGINLHLHFKAGCFPFKKSSGQGRGIIKALC